MIKRLKNPVFLIKVLSLGILCALLVNTIRDDEYFRLLSLGTSFVLVFLCDIARKVKNIKISVFMETIYLTFLFVAMILGIDLQLYATVPHMDKVVHMTSGVLSAVFAVFVLKYFGVTGVDRRFQVLFIVFFSMAIAVSWEFFEFACDRVLGTKMQNLVSTGVGDTMFDMIVATCGSVITAVYIEARWRKKNKAK